MPVYLFVHLSAYFHFVVVNNIYFNKNWPKRLVLLHFGNQTFLCFQNVSKQVD